MATNLEELCQIAQGPMWLVGGCVRDALLGRPSVDFDVAVAEDPQKIARAFARRVEGTLFPLDEERGIFRVTSSQGDPKIVFDFCRLQGLSIEDDLKKRDFTVNALALPPARWGTKDWRKHLIDVTGGVRDMQKRRIQMVSAANMVDDPLRLLRAYRFAAQLGFAITPDTVKVVRRYRIQIRRSAPERVRMELLFLLSSSRAAATLASMDSDGLLSVLFPEVDPMRRTGHAYYGKGGVLTHSLAAVRSLEQLLEELPHQFPKFHRALAAHLDEKVGTHPRWAYLKLVELFHDIGKPSTMTREGKQLHFYGHDAVGGEMVRRIGERLRFSSSEVRSMSRQVGAHMRPGNLGQQPTLSDRAAFRFYRDLEGDAVGLLVVALADHFTYLSRRKRRARTDPVYLIIRRLMEKYFLKKSEVVPPKVVDGHEIMRSLRIKPGPEVGRILAAIREAQAAGEVTTKKEALTLAKTLCS